MKKNEKTLLYVLGGIAALGGVATAIYFATRPKTTALASTEKDAVQGAIEGGMKTESAPVANNDVPDAEKQQPPPQPPPQLPPQIQIPKNLNQI